MSALACGLKPACDSVPESWSCHHPGSGAGGEEFPVFLPLTATFQTAKRDGGTDGDEKEPFGWEENGKI